jgi:hypothetical protein
MKLTSALIILAFAMLTAHAQTNLSSKDPDESSGVSGANLERMPESLEVRFELSAVPPHLRDGATTYVLDPGKGYVLGHKGTSGVSCIVVRSDWQLRECQKLPARLAAGSVPSTGKKRP